MNKATQLPTHKKQMAIRLAQGKPSKVIAAELSIPVGTVNNFRSVLIKSLGLRNATELAHLYLHQGLIRNNYASRDIKK